MPFILSALALLILSSSAHAQSTGAPTYSVGDTWTVKAGDDTREVKVLKVEGGSTEILGYLLVCPTCIFRLDHNLAVLAVLDGTGKPADRTQISGQVPLGARWQMYNWPLEPQKAWDFSAQAFLHGTTQTYDLKNRVEKVEDVTTPAGTFKAYKIVRDWLMRGRVQVGRTQDSKWQTTTWFAPDVKFFVKTMTTSTAGDVPPARRTGVNVGAQDQELISYRIK